MSTIAIAVPKEYGYVILATAGTFFLGLYHAMRVPTFRKAAKMGYPAAYADSYDLKNAETPELRKKMYLFNCSQRSHYNYLENVGSVSLSLLIAGLQWPLTTSALGAAWLVFRTMYMFGYTRADKTNGSGRLIGSGFWLAQLGLYGMVAAMGVKMAL